MPITQLHWVHKWVGAVAHQCVGIMQAHNVHSTRHTSHGLAFPLYKQQSSSVSGSTETWIKKRELKSEGWSHKWWYSGVWLLLSRMSWRAAHFYLWSWAIVRCVFFIDDSDLWKKIFRAAEKTIFKGQPGGGTHEGYQYASLDLCDMTERYKTGSKTQKQFGFGWLFSIHPSFFPISSAKFSLKELLAPDVCQK